MITGQIVLPCCWPQQPPPKHEWIGRQYPMTAEERTLVERGIRLARFVDDVECRDHCPFGPYDHTVGWTYQTKVCLKDLARLGLWTPPQPEVVEKPLARFSAAAMRLDERSYRIQHRPSGLWADVKADSAAEAVLMAGRNHPNAPGSEWRIEDCWVRQYTDRGGWGKVRR